MKIFISQEANATANFLLHSAEQSVQAAVSLAEPVLTTLQRPLMATDTLICNTMDKFVECNARAKETQRKVNIILLFFYCLDHVRGK